ncbi:MAG: VWA domain-containing protein [Candidatus Omnitrophota bacterium]|nr:VWA domain-containing protein [Candidatus Omnitrophota bacterium]
MRLNKTVLFALLISLVAHGVFFASSSYIVLPGMREVMDQTRRMFRLEDVEEEIATVKLFEKADQVPAMRMSHQGPTIESITFEKMILEEKVGEEVPLESKKKKMDKDRLNEMLPSLEDVLDAESMLTKEAEKAKREAAPEKRSFAERLLTEKVVAQRITSGASDRELALSPAKGGLDEPALDTDVWGPFDTGVFQAGEEEIAAMQGRTQLADYEDIGGYLEVKLYTYTEPGTGEKYYKLVISVKKESRILVIPKEVVFLIDSSKSITEEKLTFIKAGLRDSLERLNPGDHFNVVAFRGDLVKFREHSVRATKRTVTAARSFVKQLKAVGQTDVENALLDIIEEPISFYPSYIVLVTDGRPTTGVMDSRRIIQQITRRNNMQRPIFSFGGGRKVNRYLLDFISYQNRAWSCFASTTYGIRRDFEQFYLQIKDPFLLNVRYRLIGLDAKEIYPKFLSDFYRGKPFSLYGRFADEDTFSMQLLGEIGGMKKELIFEKSFKEAEPGTAEIARDWAFRKIYYLISRNTMGMGDPSRLRSEIDGLSRKYNIKTPYDIEDGD